MKKTTAFPPGSAHTPLGETVPDRLAVSTHRQAPASSQTHCFPISAWRSTPCRQAPVQCRLTHIKVVAWRLSTDHQAPYQKHPTAVFGTLTNLVPTRTLPQSLLFPFINTLCKLHHHTINNGITHHHTPRSVYSPPPTISPSSLSQYNA